ILLVLAAAGMFIYHRVKEPKNLELMKANGYYEPVSVGDHSLNLVRYGGAEDKHRIVALSGNGSGFPVEIKELADSLTDEAAVYCLARPGYDGSDDVTDEMTVEYEVEQLRTALQNAGVKAPYILLPHSFASLPASYWVSKYPDEIEGLINLDGSPAAAVSDEMIKQAADEFDKEAGSMKIMKIMMKLGVSDVVPGMFFAEYDDYTADEKNISYAMGRMTYSSSAFFSELKNSPVSMNTTWNVLDPENAVPKVYVNVTNGFHTIEELEQFAPLSEYSISSKTEGFGGSDEERKKLAYEKELSIKKENYEHSVQPFIEKLGSCEVVDLPGDHFDFYRVRREECTKLIKDFLGRIEKEKSGSPAEDTAAKNDKPDKKAAKKKSSKSKAS
nr:alpha/beta hydrolase [Ruminococcus sp.]